MSITNTFILPHPPMIIPEIGKGEEEKIRKTREGYEIIAKKIAEIKPETIVLISPHASMYADYINISIGKNVKGDFSNFSAGNIEIKSEYDGGFIGKISEIAYKKNIPAGILGTQGDGLDHGVMVPLYFINKYYTDYKLVRIGISSLPFKYHYELGKIIQEVSELKNNNTVLIASGDLSHKLLEDGPYGYSEEGSKFDKKIGEIIQTGKLDEFFEFDDDLLETVAQCGICSFVTMAGALDKKKIKTELYSLEGPFGVGYVTGSFEVIGEDENNDFFKKYFEKQQDKISEIRRNEDAFVRLARRSLEKYIIEDKVIKIPDNLPVELTKTQAGVFVTIYKEGKLRGCIGTIEPAKSSIAKEIIENAISSGTRDPRFPRVEESELKELIYSVDILREPEEITTLEEMDPFNYGLIVSSGDRRGLLLPNLPGVETPEEQLKITRKKAGIHAYEDQKLERFKVVRHK